MVYLCRRCSYLLTWFTFIELLQQGWTHKRHQTEIILHSKGKTLEPHKVSGQSEISFLLVCIPLHTCVDFCFHDHLVSLLCILSIAVSPVYSLPFTITYLLPLHPAEDVDHLFLFPACFIWYRPKIHINTSKPLKPSIPS